MPQYSWTTHVTANTPQAIQESKQRFLAEGPCLPAEIHVPDVMAEALRKRGQRVPPPRGVLALIDSGASMSAIDREDALALGLVALSFADVATPAGSQQQAVHGVKIEFPGSSLPTVPLTLALGASLKTQGIGILLGRDYLSDKVLIVNGDLRLFTICY